jgi:hypothetical protein
VANNQVIDDEAMAGEGCQRCDLIALHMPAIALDIGGQDRDEFTFETGRFHDGLQRAITCEDLSQGLQ